MKINKKGIAVVLLGMLTSVAFATETARATIMLSSPAGGTDELKLVEDTQYSDAFDNGADATKIISTSLSKSVNLYGKIGTEIYSTVATNNLEDLKIEVMTNKVDTDYTISFKNISGREIKFVDYLLDSVIVVTSTTEYAFVADKNQTISNRFAIYKPFTPDPGELNVCWRYEEIQILNNPYAGNIVVKDAQGNKVKDVAPKSTPQFISLKDLTPGRYTLEMDNGKDVLTFKK